jgi:hypothetical protein
MSIARLMQMAAAGGGPKGLFYRGGFIGATTNSNGNHTFSLTALSGGLGSEPVSGDIVVVFIGVTQATVDFTLSMVTSGYTVVAEMFQSDTWGSNLLVAYKIMGAIPDTSVVYNTSGGGIVDNPDTATVMGVQVWQGVDTDNPMDVTATQRKSANTRLINPPDITPVTAGAVIIQGGSGSTVQGSGVGDVYSSVDLSNFLTLSGAKFFNSCVGFGSYGDWESGVFNSATFTNSGPDGTALSYCSVSLALRPA